MKCVRFIIRKPSWRSGKRPALIGSSFSTIRSGAESPVLRIGARVHANPQPASMSITPPSQGRNGCAIGCPRRRNNCCGAGCRSSDLIYPHRVGETYGVKYNPAHRWFYIPEMRTDEVLLLKCYDSELDGRARFLPHTAFIDPTTPSDAPPRESIELRTLVFHTN